MECLDPPLTRHIKSSSMLRFRCLLRIFDTRLGKDFFLLSTSFSIISLFSWGMVIFSGSQSAFRLIVSRLFPLASNGSPDSLSLDRQFVTLAMVTLFLRIRVCSASVGISEAMVALRLRVRVWWLWPEVSGAMVTLFFAVSIFSCWQGVSWPMVTFFKTPRGFRVSCADSAATATLIVVVGMFCGCPCTEDSCSQETWMACTSPESLSSRDIWSDWTLGEHGLSRSAMGQMLSVLHTNRAL